ncbi:MAG TPA: hypothetical protein VJ726_00385 [Candidatus Limnocylindria bacterium]|nr:hypothetical protein [Candidatus Limnocylindria bacterium]
MSDGGRLGEARELGDEPSHARRQALGQILRPRAQAIQDDTLGHAYRATNFLGFGAVGAKRWASISSRGVPKFLDALEADDADRTRLLDEAGTFIADLRAAGFQRFAVKPLVSLGFRLALRDVRAHAEAEGFDPEDLEDELRVFQRAFEARILYRS